MEDEECWLQLEDYRLLLLKTIEPSRITPYLRQCKVLSGEDEEQIFNDPSLVLRRRRVGVLLDILQRTGVKGHVAFLESLELDYPQLYRKITGKEPARAFSMLVDTVGESGLTQFLMSEVTRLQKGLAEERRRRQAASAAAVGLQDADRQQQLKERELQTQQERLQRLRAERDRYLEELRHLKDDNYGLMLQVTKLSEEKNCALMASRDLQLEIEKLKHNLMKAESDFQIQHRRSKSLRNIVERWPGQDTMTQLQNQNHLLSARLQEIETKVRQNHLPSARLQEIDTKGNASGVVSAQLPDKQGRDSVVADQKAGDQVQRPVEVQSCSWELQGRRRSLGDQERAERADDQNPGVVRAGVPGEQRQMSGGVEDSEPLVNGEQISSIYSLKRELHISQEQRDRYWEEKEVLELKCTTLKKDTKMYRQRMEDILKQLEEVMKERNKALASREESHQENCRSLLEKDQYRRQIRELGERCDDLQAKLFRKEGEVLALKTRLRKHCTNHDGSQTTSEEDCKQKLIKERKASSEEMSSGTFGENYENMTLLDQQRPAHGDREQNHSAEGPPYSVVTLPRMRCNFDHRRKLALRSKVHSRVHPPHDDSSGSDNTDSDGI
ncbi:caspase recruitment domain-containing protein 9 isoform X2 [Hypomesus transpacificus]|uniref:caspase recruitment domain-containing protein 9 isoform X2 n=1 Tax=Hypomesus transpacificus TaxID=137520 RepID=UPI001F084A78|nr:caspase recruitment domain-containing protein 9 isoform X2 [Hypomesus transpacificus]